MKTKKLEPTTKSLRTIAMTVFFCLLLFVFGLFLFRCSFYGIGSPDESYYLTVPYRIYLGDALLVDEWNAVQFSAFLQYLPLVSFIRFTGTTDGIILFFRILFVVCQTAVSVFVFSKMKRFGLISGFFSAALFLIYVPEFVKTLSYYTMSLMAFELITLIFFLSDRISWPVGVFVGILVACAVSVQPFNAFFYFGYTFIVFFFFIRKRSKKNLHVSWRFSLNLWGSISVGVLLTAVVFFAFVLSQESISVFLQSIPRLFQEYEHPLPFSGTKNDTELGYITLFKTLFHLHPAGFCLSLLLSSVLLLDKKRAEHRWVWIGLLCVFYLFYVIYMLIRLCSDVRQNLFSPYLLFVATLHSFLLTKKRNRQLICIWCMGLIYILCLGIISQAMDHVGVIGCVISNTSFFPAVTILIEELRKDINKENSDTAIKKKSVVTNSFLITSVLCAVSVLASNAATIAVIDQYDIFYQKKTETEREIIKAGPMQGLFVSKDEKTAYDLFCADLKTITDLAPGRIFVEGSLTIPWLYLAADSPPATFTTWYSKESPEILEEYYNCFSEHIARSVYVPFVCFYTDRKDITIRIINSFENSSKNSLFSLYPFFNDYTIIKGTAGYILISPDKQQ